MEPLLFKFKKVLHDDGKMESLIYDEQEELVKVVENGLSELVINSKNPFSLGTKSAKVGSGEDQKASLFGK